MHLHAWLSCRVNHLERDNNQKRSLVESQRIKLKAFQDSGKAHDDAMVSWAPWEAWLSLHASETLEVATVHTVHLMIAE